MSGPAVPLWALFALAVGIVAWIFVWYLALEFIADIGSDRDSPTWHKALSFALWMPGIFIAGLGFLGLGALFVASVGAIVTR